MTLAPCSGIDAHCHRQEMVLPRCFSEVTQQLLQTRGGDDGQCRGAARVESPPPRSTSSTQSQSRSKKHFAPSVTHAMPPVLPSLQMMPMAGMG